MIPSNVTSWSRSVRFGRGALRIAYGAITVEQTSLLNNLCQVQEPKIWESSAEEYYLRLASLCLFYLIKSQGITGEFLLDHT